MVDLLFGRVVVECPQCPFVCIQHTTSTEAAICGMAHDVHCPYLDYEVNSADGTRIVLGHRDGIDRLRKELQEKWQR